MSIYAALTDSDLADEAEKHAIAAFFGDDGAAVVWYAADAPEPLVAELLRRRRRPSARPPDRA